MQSTTAEFARKYATESNLLVTLFAGFARMAWSEYMNCFALVTLSSLVGTKIFVPIIFHFIGGPPRDLNAKTTES